jgi:hypothetical protein
MRFQLIMALISVLYLSGCGNRSQIKNSVESKRLAETYGDGHYVIRTVTFPLEDAMMAFKTPLPGIGPIFGGILKFVGDIFAKSTNMGRMEMSYTQPIPEIPEDIIKSVRLKRVFFYMKPQNQKRKRMRDWFERVIMGKGNSTFSFLERLAVKMTAVKLEDPNGYIPSFTSKVDSKGEETSLKDVFVRNTPRQVVDTEKARELVLLKYNKKTRLADTSETNYGQIHILETTKDPREIKYFLMDTPSMKGFYKRILILEKSILIELVKDPVAAENFKMVMADNAGLMEDMGVDFIDSCTKESCMELTVPDVNLVPIAKKGNGLKMDALLHADRVPDSFKLKGFVEFEIAIDSPI